MPRLQCRKVAGSHHHQHAEPERGLYAALPRGLPCRPYIRIEMADSLGPDANPISCRSISEPFFTTKAAVKGTGPGLSMVYGFMSIQRHIFVSSSEVGHGTVFVSIFRSQSCGRKSSQLAQRPRRQPANIPATP